MDDGNKKNPYDDFWNERSKDSSKDSEHEQEQETTSSASDVSSTPTHSHTEGEPSKPSYYYSYGPFKPGSQQDTEPATASRVPDQAYTTASSPSDRDTEEPQVREVEVTPPTQLRPYTPAQGAQKGNWQVRERKRTSFKSIFASFLTGVVVVGVLMFSADYNNWFTASEALLPQNTAANGQKQTTGGTGGATTAAARPDNIAKLFETASPAVVKIETYQKANSGGGSGSMLDDDFFRQFFGEEAPQPKQDQGGEGQLQPTGIGTGFFFDSTGYILTNQHVIGDADEINVTVQGYDKPLKGELLGSSYELDLAVVKVSDSKAFPTLPLGSSNDINIGDWVIAIGNPYGFDHTITVGVLSAKERPIDIPDQQGTRQYKHLLQTDASINPGNSGGPLLNEQGEVIGINTAVSSQAQGIGFAIPTSTIQEVLDNLKNNKEIPKPAVPFIGAELTDVTEDMAAQLKLDKAEGSIVRNVYYNSPAYLADLKQFDVITGIDGKKFTTKEKLIAEIQKRKVGDKVDLNIFRGGKAMNLQVEIGDRNKFNTQQ
ncbi:S1C family serine protease [Paenibacillus sp. GCM10023252]|uniref:S1C family serine protease n=1 Tax=Paenibacillus sp. GCM10023252 TaxID=3252649 RepID=UPI00360C5774